MFSMLPIFPDGRRGLLLLLMRLTVGLLLVLVSLQQRAEFPWALIPFGLAAGALFLGLFTRVIAAMSAFGIAIGAAVIGHLAGLVVALHLVTIMGLILLGGGAYSLDAQLFGRRIVHLSD